MPISLILTPFDHFQIRQTFAVTPNLILEPCHTESYPTVDAFFPQRGAIWYQGETNVWNENRDLYGCAFPAMIDTWRKIWSTRYV